MIKIGMKGLAKYMTSNESQKRRILRDYKFRDPEGSAQAIYYREARDLIEAFHAKSHDLGWLMEKAGQLRALAEETSGLTKSRLVNNARAFQLYQQHFGSKVFEVKESLRKKLQISGVAISIIPDLHVVERGIEKLIKLEFAKDQLDTAIP